MKFDACVVSVFTSNGAVVITTSDSLLYGIICSGSSNAAIINVHQGITTGGDKKFIANVPATAASVEAPPVPIVCAGGITTTNIGSVSTYAVMYVKQR